MATVNVLLSPSGIPPEDFEAWVDFAANRLPELVGLDFFCEGDVGLSADAISTDREDDYEAALEAIRVAWEEFCSEPSP